jgi:hypothetical protein
MPQYKIHIQAGIITWALLLFGMSWGHRLVTFARAAELLLFTILGSLVPDIDTRSKGRAVFFRLYLISAILLIIFRWWNILASMSAVVLLAWLAPHRALFHNIWFICCMVMSAVLFARTISSTCAMIVLIDGLFFIAGALSHILLDVGLRRLLYFRW